MLKIAVINESAAVSDADVKKMIPAFSQQWNRDLRPVWGIGEAKFHFVPKKHVPASGSWWVVFLDNSDHAGSLAYHDLTDEGFPLSKVFAKTLLAENKSLSVGATHEICEMAVDPWMNGCYQDHEGIFWAAEVCDPVESAQYGYKIGGVLVTNFVTPNWFAHKNAQKKIDFKDHLKSPFQLLRNGYALKHDPHHGWQQVTQQGVKTIPQAAPEGSRRERRARHWKGWQRSRVKGK
jgi:hypothetical protein